MITRTALLLTAAAITAQAATISVNFHALDGASDGIESAQVAGLTGYAASNWNNTDPASGTVNDLTDSDGLTTTADITWSSGGSWGDGSANATVGTDPNADLARGYLDDGAPGISISITDIPFADYDVVVYFSTDTEGGIYRPVTINGSSFSSTGTKSQWGTNPTWDATNTAVATGQSGDLTLTGLTRNGANRGSIAGIQVVQIPEPSSTALLGLAGLGLILRRRK